MTDTQKQILAIIWLWTAAIWFLGFLLSTRDSPQPKVCPHCQQLIQEPPL